MERQGREEQQSGSLGAPDEVKGGARSGLGPHGSAGPGRSRRHRKSQGREELQQVLEEQQSGSHGAPNEVKGAPEVA